MQTSQLADAQLEAFDREYVNDRRWGMVKPLIDRDFPDGQFSFIDIGGGNGVFADRVLAAYPRSEGSVLDSSEMLLSKNKSHGRKKLILGDAISTQKADIVFFNWVLHHLVKTGDYSNTRQNMLASLRGMDAHRISVFENEYDGFIDGFPSAAIFGLTSSRLLSPLTKRMGANTAGVGVCFLSHSKWVKLFKDAGLEFTYTPETPSKLPAHIRAALLIKEVRRAHFWLSSNRGSSLPKRT